MHDYVLGHVAGLRLSARPSAIIALPALWAVCTLAAAKQLHVTLRTAGSLALVAVLGHWGSGIWHHLGHALAARTTGYPMVGIRFWGLLATSVYPADEPPLPAAIHVRRALGGPFASALLALILWISQRTRGSMPASGRWLLRWLLLDNVLTFTAQMLVPLGFNDGTTLRRWLPELWNKTSR